MNKWITRDLIEQDIFLRQLYQLAKQDADLTNQYKIIKKSHQKNIYNAKRNYYDDVISKIKNKSRASWNMIE